MSFYIHTGNVEQLLQKILQGSSRVWQLVHCPLFLRMFASLVNLEGENQVLTIIHSTASVFDKLIGRLQCCSHNAGEIQDTAVLNRIMKLAYKKTMEGSVVIDQSDLSSVGIKPGEMQDLVIGIHGDSNSALIGPNLFYFSHQSIQVSV